MINRWLLSQRWDDLLFAHWSVEPRGLRRLLPSAVEPDVRDGRAWVGIVAFRMTDTRAAGLVPPRGLGSIPELNLRTYVRVNGRPGVWFLTLDTSSPLFVGVGRALYGLAYRRATMVVSRSGTRIHYASTHGPHAFVASYEPVGPAAAVEAGSLEEWLVERYRLFACRRRELVSADVLHPPWLLQRADVSIELNTLAPPELALDGEPLLHFSRGVDALISAPHVGVDVSVSRVYSDRANESGRNTLEEARFCGRRRGGGAPDRRRRRVRHHQRPA
jgi:uncharacterized protein